MAKSCGGLATKADDLDGEAYYPASRSLGNDLHEIPIGIAQQGVAVVVTAVVRRLDCGNPGSDQLPVGSVDVVGPHNQGHRRASRCRLDPVDLPGSLSGTETDGEPVQAHLDVQGYPFTRSPKGFGETEEIAVEGNPGLDAARLDIDQWLTQHRPQAI